MDREALEELKTLCAQLNSGIWTPSVVAGECFGIVRTKVPALIAEVERLSKENVELKTPDYAYDAKDWEYSIGTEHVLDLGDGLGVGDAMRVGYFRTLPERWLARVPTAINGDGEPEDDELQWFDTEEEAKAAIAALQSGGSNASK